MWPLSSRNCAARVWFTKPDGLASSELRSAQARSGRLMQTQANYGEFSSRIHAGSRGLGKPRIPLEVSIEVTRRCPLACLHCYNNLPMNDAAARRAELTLDEHGRLLDELVEAGCLWLLYTGGEVFARADFLDIYRAAKSRGFLITLFTNGTMITPRVADVLAEWRPFSVEITLYGRTRETYEALTQIPGSYDRCMRGIHALLERGLPLKLKTVPTTINLHEVYAMKELAEGLGAEFKFDPLLNPRIDCSLSPLAVRLSPEEVVALDFRDPHREREYGRLLQEETALGQGMNSEPGHVYFCGGGMNSMAVDPEGRMSICVLSHRDTYDWRRGSFRDAWENFFPRVRLKPKTRPTKCDSCRIQSLCGMCPANAELENNGDAEEPVEFLCQVAHLRAAALAATVPAHGDCAFCDGGVRYAEVVQSAARIRRREIHLGERLPARPQFAILGATPPGAGCGSRCGSCAAHS